MFLGCVLRLYAVHSVLVPLHATDARERANGTEGVCVVKILPCGFNGCNVVTVLLRCPRTATSPSSSCVHRTSLGTGNYQYQLLFEISFD